MEKKINFEILSKEELKNLSKEELIKAKEYFEYYNNYNKSLKAGVDYQRSLDYDNQNDIKYYDEKIDFIDNLIAKK